MTELDSVLSESISDLFAERVRNDRAPGVYFAMFDRDGVILEAGFGERRLGGEVPDADTAFRIASCTKSFTAATLLALRDRGQVDLDAPITDFVPSFVPNSPASDPVTPSVRMLMSMSGGLPTDDPWGDRQEAMTRDELDAFLAQGVPAVSVPGTAFEYSNLGYALLGQVIAAVTGGTYFDAVKAEQFDRLGLDSTGYDSEVVPPERLALGYRRSGDEWVELPFSDKGVFSAMGGIFSTATDLGRWAQWLSAEPSSRSRREQQQIHRTIAGGEDAASGLPTGYGFGLFVEHDPRWGRIVHHSGGYPGFSTHMRWSTETGIGIVAFENATYSGVSVPASAALRMALESREAPDLLPKAWPEVFALAETAQQLSREWDDVLADWIFTGNVAEDIPYAERVDLIAAAVAEVGEVEWDAAPQDASSNSPAQRTWFVPAANGRLRFELLLAPTNPPLIQRLSVSAERG